jgi:hypothetical protein
MRGDPWKFILARLGFRARKNRRHFRGSVLLRFQRERVIGTESSRTADSNIPLQLTTLARPSLCHPNHTTFFAMARAMLLIASGTLPDFPA